MELWDTSGYSICGIHTPKDVKYFQEEISIPLSGWRLTDTISTEFLYQDIYELRTFMFVVSLGLLMICLLATFFAIYSQLRPLFKLKEQMQQVMAGNLNAEIATTDSKDEISSLSRTFNNMVTEIGHLIEEIQVTQKRESELRFEMLLAQINPHFLFNTLNSINRTVMLGRREQALTMLDSLSVLLRYNLADAQMPALLGEELGITEEYLKIQKMRFSSRLNVDVRHDRKLEQAVTLPRFTLQPLVENAVIHGLEPKEEGGTLILDVRKTGNYIRIRICDNGMGMEKERLEKIRRRLSEKQPERIGVWNIWQRLSLYTGRDDSLKIMSKKGAGTIVSIYLHRGEEDV